MKPKQPDQSIIEMIVFGGVRGYGESILIHLGNKNWIIIDSCLNESEEPAAISYLNSINVDVSRDVKLIVATHWHDDHIKGLSKILSECSSADFAMPRVFRQRNFLEYLKINRMKPLEQIKFGRNGSEFLQCLSILDKNKLRLASEDNLLWMKGASNFKHDRTVEVFSLSPSEFQFNDFLSKIEQYSKSSKKQNGQMLKRKEIFGEENELAVAILVKIGEYSILLGSDVEIGNSEFGWKRIINNWEDQDVKSSVYKVAHHGSPNADYNQTWTKLLIEYPISIVTPYSQGKYPNPNQKSIENLKQKSKAVYITSQIHLEKIKFKKGDSKYKVDLERVIVDDYFQCGAVSVIFNVVDNDINVKSHNGACKL